MILFVSGATVTMKRYRRCGELIVPGAGGAPDSLRLSPGRWAMDNGAYTAPYAEVDTAAFVRMLERFHGRLGCRFVAAPDRPMDAHQTLVQWPFWSRLIRGVGFAPALVGQDGMTVEDIPWREIGAFFIGGSTEWKLGPQATTLASYAKSRGLWVHMGRVNSQARIGEAARMGVDSIDGSQHSWFPDRRIPESLDNIEAAVSQGRLC